MHGAGSAGIQTRRAATDYPSDITAFRGAAKVQVISTPFEIVAGESPADFGWVKKRATDANASDGAAFASTFVTLTLTLFQQPMPWRYTEETLPARWSDLDLVT